MMTSLRAILLATTVFAALPALAAEDAAPAAATPAAAPATAAPAKDYTIIKLGAEEIKNSEVMDIWKGLFPGGASPDFNSFDENIRQNVLRGLVSEKLIYQEALKSGVDKSDDVKKRIAAVEKQVIMQSFMEQKAKGMVTDAQLKAAYDEKVKAMAGQEEVKARHILVADEAEAKKLSEQLKKKPADFEKIAKEKSTDKASGANGGDLGWFTKDKMVPEFANAAYEVKKGEVSAPVKSAFGWHIIKVDDRRPLQAPAFDEMKEALRGELTNKAVQGYVEGLLKSAEIKYYGTDGKEKPFSRSLTPPAGMSPAAGGAAPAEAAPAEPKN